jgi:hypothetical protein
MAITITLPVDASGNKTKIKLGFFSQDSDGEVVNGSALVRYVSAVDNSDLPATGTILSQRTVQETEMSLQLSLQKFINPPSLVYVTSDTVGAKQVSKHISERRGTQLTGVVADQDLKQHTEGVFKKLVEILQANGELPV